MLDALPLTLHVFCPLAIRVKRQNPSENLVHLFKVFNFGLFQLLAGEKTKGIYIQTMQSCIPVSHRTHSPICIHTYRVSPFTMSWLIRFNKRYNTLKNTVLHISIKIYNAKTISNFIHNNNLVHGQLTGIVQ